MLGGTSTDCLLFGFGLGLDNIVLRRLTKFGRAGALPNLLIGVLWARDGICVRLVFIEKESLDFSLDNLDVTGLWNVVSETCVMVSGVVGAEFLMEGVLSVLCVKVTLSGLVGSLLDVANGEWSIWEHNCFHFLKVFRNQGRETPKPWIIIHPVEQ